MEDQDINAGQQMNGALFFRNMKKVLDKGGVLWYYSQARLRGTAGRASEP